MTTTERLLIAAGGGAVTFALILFATHIRMASKLPSGFGLIPFYLLLPAEILGEVLASRAAFLITGFVVARPSLLEVASWTKTGLIGPPG